MLNQDIYNSRNSWVTKPFHRHIERCTYMISLHHRDIVVQYVNGIHLTLRCDVSMKITDKYLYSLEK